MNLIEPELLPLPAGLKIRTQADGTTIGRFLRSDLSSVFQPIFAGDGAIVGHEAYVRAHGQGARDIAPWHLFSLVASDDALVALDRLCRAVHALNFQSHQVGSGRLFLNVHGRLLAAVREDHGHSFRDVVGKLGLDVGQIVIETPESANDEAKLLAFVLSNYRLNGFAVAANVRDPDDLAALLSMVRPDYVKLDARQFTSASSMETAIARVNDSGAHAVFTRIENPAQRDWLGWRDGVWRQGRALGDAERQPSIGFGEFPGSLIQFA